MALGTRDPVDRKRRVLSIGNARCVLVERVTEEVLDWYSEYMVMSVYDIIEGERVRKGLRPVYGETAYLATIDVSTGDATIVGTLNQKITAVVFDKNGNLYGVSGSNCGIVASALYSINKNNANIHKYPFCNFLPELTVLFKMAIISGLIYL